VNFPNPKLHFWSLNGHSKLASAIGKPIFAYRCTVKKEHINYSRVLVEADVSSALPMTISIWDLFGNMLLQ